MIAEKNDASLESAKQSLYLMHDLNTTINMKKILSIKYGIDLLLLVDIHPDSSIDVR